MNERTVNVIRHLPREELESFAVRAALQLRSDREEIEAGRLFTTILTAFLLGVTVAASGLLLGLVLG